MRIFFRVLLVSLFVTLTALMGFCLLNLTLLKNFSNAFDTDIWSTEKLTPLTIINGRSADGGDIDQVDVPVSATPAAQFTDLEKAWAETGGQALIVWHDGEIKFEKYNGAAGPDQLFRSFSMHKSIVGLIAAMMAHEGLMDLDDPISMYVDEYRDGNRDDITIRHALQHVTGLDRLPRSFRSLKFLEFQFGDDVEATALKVARVNDTPVFDYSNINYQIAGAALRRILREKLGLSYAEYLQQRLWVPIGANPAKLWTESRRGAPRFYAGLQATPRDWLRIGMMLADNGIANNAPVFAKEVLDVLTAPSQSNPNYGLGVWVGEPADGTREYGPSTALAVRHSAPFADEDVFFFDGFGGQRVYISRQTRTVIVRSGEIRFDWDDALLYNLAVSALQNDVAP